MKASKLEEMYFGEQTKLHWAVHGLNLLLSRWPKVQRLMKGSNNDNLIFRQAWWLQNLWCRHQHQNHQKARQQNMLRQQRLR